MDQGECTDSPRVVRRVCDRACPLSGGETYGPAGGRCKCPIPCSSRCRCMHVMRVSCRAGCRRGRSAGRASRDPSFRARGASQGRVMSNKPAAGGKNVHQPSGHRAGRSILSGLRMPILGHWTVTKL